VPRVDDGAGIDCGGAAGATELTTEPRTSGADGMLGLELGETLGVKMGEMLGIDSLAAVAPILTVFMRTRAGAERDH